MMASQEELRCSEELRGQLLRFCKVSRVENESLRRENDALKAELEMQSMSLANQRRVAPNAHELHTSAPGIPGAPASRALTRAPGMPGPPGSRAIKKQWRNAQRAAQHSATLAFLHGQSTPAAELEHQPEAAAEPEQSNGMQELREV
eukprot:GEMP01050392.1.p1 GENE.GEMP01050392.1~~GEMP01050392.1.p1  ORF type:complete len:170 (+),score=45.33 GEMP01050392.1:72-512(+)